MGCGLEKLVDSLVVLCQAVVLCWLVRLVGYDVEGWRRVFLTPRKQARGGRDRLTLLRWKEDFAERLGAVCRIITELLRERLVPPPPPPPPPPPLPKSKW